MTAVAWVCAVILGTAQRQYRTDAEQEALLRNGEIVQQRSAPSGITKSTLATLRRGVLAHEVHIQAIDVHEPKRELATGSEFDLRDSYKNNVAAYRLDRLLGLGMVPVAVVRRWNGAPAAFSWWVDDVLMLENDRQLGKISPPDVEAWDRQMYVLRLFDQLIYNTDRNLKNVVIDEAWRVWMIDHTRAFKIAGDLPSEEDLGARCERRLLGALRLLEKASLRAKLQGLLDQAQIDGLLLRRDKILRHFDRLIAAEGAAAVLYELPPRAGRPRS